MEVNSAVKLLKYSKEGQRSFREKERHQEFAKRLGLVSSEHNLMFFDSAAKPAVACRKEEVTAKEGNDTVQTKLNDVYCWIVASMFVINVIFVGMIFVLTPRTSTDTCS